MQQHRGCKRCRRITIQFHMAHARTLVDTDITATHPVTAAEEDAGHKIMGIGADYAALEPTVILHITVG